MVHVGIIGCGKIAQVRHLPEYFSNGNAKIIGITDINEERAKALAEKYACKAYKTREEMLADTAIDAVSVCTANHTHAEIAIEALRAGKHVLCEKPMAVTLEECEHMVSEAKAHDRFLMIGQNQRLAKAHVKARELVKNGTLGKIISFRTVFGHGGPETWSVDPGKDVWFFDRTKAAMGAMADLGIHKTDLIQFLLGDTIVETTARLATLDKKDAHNNMIGVDDNAICIYRTKGGVIGTMTASWTYYGQEDNSTVLYGTKGILRIYDDPGYSMKFISSGGEEIVYKLDAIQTNDSQTKSGVIDEFVGCIAAGKQPEICGESVLSAMRAVFASIESSETGRTVYIKENA